MKKVLYLTMLLILVSNSYADIGNYLVAYYSADTFSDNIIRNDFNPDYYNYRCNAEINTTGLINQSLNFNQNICYNQDDDYILQSQDFSISFWLNTSGNTSYQNIWGLNKNENITIALVNNYILISMVGKGMLYTLTNAIPIGNWTSIVFTRSTNTGSVLYVNNETVDADSYDGDFDPSDYSGNYTIGSGSTDGTRYYYNGMLDELAVFNKSLNTSEINKIWYYGLGCNINLNRNGCSCTPVYENISYTEWNNQTNCLSPYLRYEITQNRSYIMHDINNCPQSENITFWENLNITCDLYNDYENWKDDYTMLALTLLSIGLLFLTVLLYMYGSFYPATFFNFGGLGLDMMLIGILKNSYDTIIINSVFLAIGSLIFYLSIPVSRMAMFFLIKRVK